MSHSDIIIIVVTLTISSTFGVYAAIRVINRHTRPPVNTLVRSGDIEMMDYIEPTHPQQIYNYPDLIGSQYPIYERISDYGTVPSYRTGTPPSYQNVDYWTINSSLENAINLEFILWLILFFMLIVLIRKLLVIYFYHVFYLLGR
jgi:hypothetical protein